MANSFYHVFNGKRYKVEKVPPSKLRSKKTKRGFAVFGDCDHPLTKNKKIRIDNTLKGKEALEVELHEGGHAIFPQFDEETIETFGKDFANYMWRLGYRKIK